MSAPQKTIALRPKRLRKTSAIRTLVQETWINRQQLIMPLFINAHLKEKRAIPSMPGQFQLALEDLDKEIEEIVALGIQGVLLFGIPEHKDERGSSSFPEKGIIQQAIRRIRLQYPSLLIIADVCFCEYTNHGHCGVLVPGTEQIDNDETLVSLGRQAVSYVAAGADWVAPSSMTDGMVGAIRSALDTAGFMDAAILSYAVKYSSSLYGPFREAAEGAPQFGDRKTYQMNPANATEALREVALDLAEGADMLMVKPALHYLDIIFRIKQRYPEVPLAAYQVSGEYSMLKYAIAQGLLEQDPSILEGLLAIKRAGADMIITYFAKEAAAILKRTA
ncbi:MAG: porphobilinogen synthase [Legionella sp.]|nr:porphobilinogen synthase [Legionella sp.]